MDFTKNVAHKYYVARVQSLEAQLKALDKKFFICFTLRLALFIGIIAFLVLFTLWENLHVFLYLSGLSLIGFLIAVIIDLRLVKQQKLLKKQLDVNNNELLYLNHNYGDFDGGDEFADMDPHLAGDFDLFGKASLFQYLNRTVTKPGRERFAQSLCFWTKDVGIIKEKQLAVNELSEKPYFLEHFQALGMLNNETGREQKDLLKWISQPESGMLRMKWLLIAYPMAMLTLIVLMSLSIIPSAFLVFPISIASWILMRKKKTVDAAHASLGRTAKVFGMYKKIITLVEKETFTTAKINSNRDKFFADGIKASSALKKFFTLLDKFDYRFNMVAAVLFNLLFLIDLQMMYRLELWKLKYKKLVPGWFDALTEFDHLTGYSRFAFNNLEDVVFPQPENGDFIFSVTAMGHPLIPIDSRVSNSVEFSGKPKVIVVTGANMAGKSTFLRTLAVNLILAMNGAPVPAKAFRFSPCDIRSSINIRDSLSHKASYFYAELVRIREIIDHVAKHPQTLVILDEILRGTNTNDKKAGSIGLLQKLIGLNTVVVIATHDLSIGELDKTYPDIVANHCFEVELEGDKLVFDYKLKDGVSKKLNASFLMKQMGVID